MGGSFTERSYCVGGVLVKMAIVTKPFHKRLRWRGKRMAYGGLQYVASAQAIAVNGEAWHLSKTMCGFAYKDGAVRRAA